MLNQFSRTELLLGQEALGKLRQKRVAVFGVGGVGGYVVEVLARSGIGAIDIIDADRVSLTNINRQIIATTSTVGQLKVDIAERRILDINPACRVRKWKVFYLPERASEIDLTQYDYVADCIDTVKAKLDIIRRCNALCVPLISSMGAACKLDATLLCVTDLWKTINDPLAKVLRKKLSRAEVKHQKVVYSPELPREPFPLSPDDIELNDNGRPAPASNAWVPAVAGLLCGSEVVKDLTGQP